MNISFKLRMDEISFGEHTIFVQKKIIRDIINRNMKQI